MTVVTTETDVPALVQKAVTMNTNGVMTSVLGLDAGGTRLEEVEGRDPHPEPDVAPAGSSPYRLAGCQAEAA